VETLSSRIENRFHTLSQDPELSTAVHSGIRSLFEHGFVPDISTYVGTEKFAAAVDAGIYAAVENVIANLSLDPLWLARVETMVNQHMHAKVNRYVSELQIENTVKDAVNGALDRWLAANPVARTPGIDDRAQQAELTVMDGAVVVERNLVARDITVANTASVQGALTVQDLAVLGTVNVDNASWHGVADRASEIALRKLTPGWQQDLVQQVLELARTQGIDFDTVTMGGEPVVASGALNSNIRNSNLETVGVLQNLTATGTVKLGNTVTILPRRLGINTMEPEMALSIWDEEISVMMGKLSQDRAYIGTGRRQGLAFGIDRKVALEIESSGMVAVKQLRVDRWIIGHDKDLPGYSGTRGDIVFNHDPKPESPFAWICLGGFRWQPLKSAP
jgi:hypothetical protein